MNSQVAKLREMTWDSKSTRYIESEGETTTVRTAAGRIAVDRIAADRIVGIDPGHTAVADRSTAGRTAADRIAAAGRSRLDLVSDRKCLASSHHIPPAAVDHRSVAVDHMFAASVEGGDQVTPADRLARLGKRLAGSAHSIAVDRSANITSMR